MPSLLAIDDDPSVLLLLRKAFGEPGVDLVTADTATEGLEKLRETRPDVVILDILLPDLSGLETFEQIRKLDSKIPVIFITASKDSGIAIEAMKLGAYDYVSKPLDVRKLKELVAKALEIAHLMNVPVEVPEVDAETAGKPDVLVGRCSSMQEVYKSIGRVAPQDITVLITGETGTGKELVARAIYHHSRRSDGPFLAVNCAAIPDNLLESELFGHEKGAFTGADRLRIGKFEQCSGGTLFLDEIGDMSPLIQSKILRLLQEQRFERLGGNETIETDVRIIAATRLDLEQMVGDGDFREDLYYRLNVYTIKLPPLRERDEDLPLLVNHFIKRFSKELGKEVARVSDATLKKLREYEWPGNIRELESILKQALLLATGPELLPSFLPKLEAPPVVDARNAEEFNWDAYASKRIAAGTKDLYAESLEQMEQGLLTAVLNHTGGNQLQAAKILGITRTSLRNKIRSLGISIDRIVRAEGE